MNVKVKVENLKQFEISLSEKEVSEIIIARDSFNEKELVKLVKKIKENKKKSWILLERISRYEEIKDLRTSTDKLFDIEDLDGIIVQNLDSFAYVLRKINFAKNERLEIELNYTMNCYNDETKKVYELLYNEKRKNAKEIPLKFTAPVELNSYELSDVGYDTMIVYSYIDTMVTANCLRKNTIVEKGLAELAHTSDCSHRFDFDKVLEFSSFIKDRKNKNLHYKTYCKYCYNKIFNTEPTYLLDIFMGSQSSPVQKNGSQSLRIDFSFENEKEVRDIFAKKIPASFTRGHYKNSIN